MNAIEEDKLPKICGYCRRQLAYPWDVFIAHVNACETEFLKRLPPLPPHGRVRKDNG